MKMSAGGECLRAARAPAVDLLAGRPSLAVLPKARATSVKGKATPPTVHKLQALKHKPISNISIY